MKNRANAENGTARGGLQAYLDGFGEALLKGFYKNAAVIIMLAVTAAALLAKFKAAPYPTQDSVGYVLDWMNKIKAAGLSRFYTVDADYSPLYLFFTGILTLIPKGASVTALGYTYSLNWLLALKGSYFVFDIMNAVAVYLIIRRISNSKDKAVIGYIIATALPVQFINSAVWGNADCIYACFLLYSLYFALCKKSFLSFFMFGFALANKLQALFLAPFLVYLLLRRRVKLLAAVAAPLSVAVSFIPAFLCGAGLGNAFSFYTKQLGGYTKLTLGCPNFWQLFSFGGGEKIIGKAAVYMGLLFIGAVFSVIFLRYIESSEENLLGIAVFLIGITVFFLPHMHERYFYLLDILTVAYTLVKGRRYYLIVLMQLASGIAYYHYISGRYFIDPWGEDSVHIAAITVVIVLGILLYDILKAKRLTLDGALEEIKHSGQIKE